MNQVAAILEQDVALCARILQLVNSSFFGLSHRISDISPPSATWVIGMLKDLALSMDVFSKLEGASPSPASPWRSSRTTRSSPPRSPARSP